MPLQKITLKSGVNRENTRYTNEGGWYESDKVRFRQGTPEKIGGWLQTSANTFLGICRSLWTWITLTGVRLLGIGTNLKFYAQRGEVFYDITPIRTRDYTVVLTDPFTTAIGSADILVTSAAHGAQVGDLVNFAGTATVGGVPAVEFNQQHTIIGPVTTNTYHILVTTLATSTATGGGTVTAAYFIQAVTLGNNPFTTNISSTTVIVTAVAHGALQGDFVTYSSATAVGGIPAGNLNKEQQIAFVVDADSYYIIVANPAATSSTSGGGAAVLAAYQINTGPASQVPTYGWGANTWGSNTWGASTATGQELRLWSQMNFGEDLVFAPRYGGLYYWSASKGTSVRGVNVTSLPNASNVPTEVQDVLVSDVSRFVIAFGANPLGGSVLDPMLVRWCDQENIEEWTPTATNQAGDLRLSHGSEIASALQVRQEILIWTDQAIYSMQFLGAPIVWGATLMGDNISIMGPNAVVTASGVAYWMGIDKFYKYDGRVSTMRCDLRQYVFNDLNTSQRYQVFAGTNEGFNEVWWFYCSESSRVVDKYVIYNYMEDVWYYGTMGRTAWLDSGINAYPLAATYALNIVQHELGVDDGTYGVNDLVPIEATITSSEFDIGDGHNFAFVQRVIPDVNFTGSTSASPTISMTLQPLTNSGSGYNSPKSVGGISSAAVVRSATIPVEKYTGQVYIRVRGRQMSMRIDSNTLGVQWQLGSPRIDIRQDGRAGGTI